MTFNFPRKFLKLLAAVLALSAAAWLAVAQINSANSAIKIIQGWRYIPVNVATWTKFTTDFQAGKFTDALDTALEMKNAGELNVINEGLLARGKALRGLEFYQAAFQYFVDILKSSPGSFAASEAMLELSQMLPLGQYDEELLQEVIGRAPPKEAPEAAIPMLAYFAAIDQQQAGHRQWAEPFFNSIGDKNFWAARIRYQKAVQYVSQDKPLEAMELFQGLLTEDYVSEDFKQDVHLQLARLLFEKSEYSQAEEHYKKIPVGDRNSGRVLYERAWNQYNLKEYSLALGLLEALKTPFFDRGLDPESYILSSIILRELCHYPEITKINQQFSKVFDAAIEYIKSAKAFADNSILLTMSIQTDPLRQQADLIDISRKELAKMKQQLDEDVVKSIVTRYQQTEKNLRDRIAPRLAVQAKKEAIRVLEISDQLKLLEYVSGLDENRIQNIFESRGYTAEKASKLTFNTLFWPISSQAQQTSGGPTEYWFEELNNFRVLVSDRCKAGE